MTKNILIIGAGRAGKLLYKDIKANHPAYRVLGFLDDNIRANKPPIIGTLADFQEISGLYAIDEIVLAVPSADGELVRRLLLANQHNQIPIKIVPRNQRIIDKSDVRYDEVRDLIPEDFLGRPFIRPNVEKLKKYYRNKVVFVTGGAGSIGSEIVRQLIDLEVRRVIVYDHSEYLVFMLEQQLKERGQLDRCSLVIGNILNTTKLDRLFKELKPDIVFHAAAYKHVHLMQENIDESLHNNVIGTKGVIDTVIANKIKLFTFISTDKVVNPTSVMGATKKLGEYYINSLRTPRTRFNVVRFGNVINSNGSALPLFERQMALHGYITVTHKRMRRFFMSIREAAQLVIESTAYSKPRSIYVLNMGELINIYEVALCLIRSKNLLPHKDVEVRITGLRKGEKLIEELYTDAESANLRKTQNSRVLSLKNQEVSPKSIEAIMKEISSLTTLPGNSPKLVRYMKKLFPSLRFPGTRKRR